MEEFIPLYDQPVSLDSLRKLDAETLFSGITSLENSLRHLFTSNEQILAFLLPSSSPGLSQEEIDPETRSEFLDSIRENEGTMCVLPASVRWRRD